MVSPLSAGRSAPHFDLAHAGKRFFAAGREHQRRDGKEYAELIRLPERRPELRLFLEAQRQQRDGGLLLDLARKRVRLVDVDGGIVRQHLKRAAEDALRKAIEAKSGSLVGSMAAQGTTPRRYTDLLGSLCDLTSGSGDKGTPIVLVQDYFTNFADE